MKTLSNTDSSLKKILYPFIVISYPAFWLRHSAQDLFWAVYTLIISNLFIFTALHLNGQRISSIFFAVILNSLVDLILLSLWAVFVDFIAQLKGYTGKVRSLILKFIFIKSIYILLLPWNLFFWSISSDYLSFSILGSIILFAYTLYLQFIAVSSNYRSEQGNGGSSLIYALGLLPALFFFYTLLSLLRLLI